MDLRKVILFLGLLAMVLLISSEVSARDLIETSSNANKEVVEETNEVNDAKYGSYNGGYPGRGGGNYYGGYPGNRGGRYPGRGRGRGNGGRHGGGYCPCGCCNRCCSYAGAVTVKTEHNTRN